MKLSYRLFDREIRYSLTDKFTEVPYVLKEMTEGKYYEEDFLLYISSLKLANTYIDCGSHLGTHLIWFAKMCQSDLVIGFEPIEIFYDFAFHNIRLNNLDAKILFHHLGVGSKVGNVENWLSSEHWVGFNSSPIQSRVEFKVVTLDDVVSSKVSLIKLDLEGMELEALKGAHNILVNHRPVIFVEQNSKRELFAMIEFLKKYSIYPSGKVFNASPTYEFIYTKSWRKIGAGKVLLKLRDIRYLRRIPKFLDLRRNKRLRFSEF